MKKTYLLSLGCPRNLTDSEILLALLENSGFNITDNPETADIAIINTCGFIQDAKEESIDAILQLAELKKEGKIKKLVVTGCLPQRYPTELTNGIKEIDAVFGTSDFMKIPGMLDTLFAGEGTTISEISAKPEFLYNHDHARKSLTLPHYVYVKIQEGCSNRCSYCVIPDLKGPRRSRERASVLEEVKRLKTGGKVREVILIGQDTTSFGLDRNNIPELEQLLEELSPVMGDDWLRLLYTHPAHFTDGLIDIIADTDNICKYIDLPIQHINDGILKRMNRNITGKDITGLIARIRNRINGVTIRTSVITGFPGETDREFGQLMDFLRETKFDRLGAFIYSQEEETPAYSFEGQVPEEVKRERFEEIMKLQQEISTDNNLKFVDRTLHVLIDEEDPDTAGRFIGRSQMDAPEVDGIIYVKGEGIKPGNFVNVKITGAMEYDLMGETV